MTRITCITCQSPETSYETPDGPQCHDCHQGDTVQVTVSRAGAEYLSMLVDIDDDPENAMAAGISYADWEDTRQRVVAAAARTP